jgi:hypothetical protein
VEGQRERRRTSTKDRFHGLHTILDISKHLGLRHEQMYLVPAWAEMFRSHGLRFHVDPYSSIAYYPYEYSEAERRFLELWIWENRRAGLESAKPDDPVTVLCSGGVDHINIQPDGSTWRCILERQLGLKPLGNVFDPGFKLLTSPLQCAESWQCPACDQDKVTMNTAG